MASLSLLGRAAVSGAIAAGATSLVAACLGRAMTGSRAAPLNAVSHVAWGDRAARPDAPSLKYTGTGLALNAGACLFWALFYEGLGRKRSRSRALRDATLTSALAYVTDYHVVPRRLTPGYELRLPGWTLTLIYAALALGLCGRDLARRRPAGGEQSSPSSRPHAATPEAAGTTTATPESMQGFAARDDVMQIAADDLARTSATKAVPRKANRPMERG